MKDEKNDHLNSSELLLALVEESRLPEKALEHFVSCRLCRTRSKTLHDRLDELGRTAESLAPPMRMKVVLPLETAVPARELVRWKYGLTIGSIMVAAAVLFISFVGLDLGRNDVRLAALEQETRADEVLMAEIDLIEESPLPQLCLELTDQSDQDLDEDFMDFVVPISDDGTLSRQDLKEGGLC
jgi:hypothetical protein